MSRGERERVLKRKEAFERLLDILQPITQTITAPAGTRLFRQGEIPDGVYFILSGKVEQSLNSTRPLRTNSRMVGRGQILGLGPVFSGKPAPANAEVAARALIGYVPRQSFFDFFQAHLEARLPVLQLLSDEVNSCYDVIRSSVVAA